MSDIPAPIPSWRRVTKGTFPALMVLGIALALVLTITMRMPLKDDVAWLLYVGRKWMDGKQLYVDLIEVNPPLIIWISAVPATLARWLVIEPRAVAMPFFASLILACAWWASGLLRALGPLYRDRMAVFAVLGTVLLLVPGNELGQREHLLIATALPYLVVTARAMHGQAPGRVASLLAGMLAAAGCMLKPRYGLAFAAVEILAVARGLRPWRIGNLGAIAVAIGYAAVVLVFYPAYMERVVPLAMALYGATDATWQRLFSEGVTMLLGLAALLLVTASALRARRPEALTLAILAAFGVAAAAVCFLDGKDWFYHRLPAIIVAVLGLVVWLSESKGWAPRRRPRLVSVIAGLTLLTFAVAAAQRTATRLILVFEPNISTEVRLEQLLKKEKARSYVAFSEWIALGFPVVNDTDVIWTSRFDSMWALKGEIWRTRFDPKGTRDFPVRRWVARDFVVGCPDIVVVDTREGVNYIGVLASSDNAFARAWSNYAQIAAFDGLRVFRRQSANCVALYADESPLLAIRR